MEPLYVVTQWVRKQKTMTTETNKCNQGKKYVVILPKSFGRQLKRIGCGVAYCDNSEVWVCNYDPRKLCRKKPY